MSKRHPNVPNPGHFKVQGGAYKDENAASAAKGAIARQRARLERRAGRKSVLGDAPPEQHRAESGPEARPQRRPSRAAKARSRLERAAQVAGERAAGAIARQRTRSERPAAPPAQRRALQRPAAPPRVEEGGGILHRVADRAERLVGLAVGAYHLGRAGVEHTLALGRAAVELWRHRHDEPTTA